MMNSEKIAEIQYELARWDQRTSKNQRAEGVQKLYALGLRPFHIEALTGLKVRTISSYLTDEEIMQELDRVGGHGPFNPKTLDALYAIALKWEQESQVNKILLRMCVNWGDSVSQIAYFTGLQVETIRNSLRG